jgi:hypothetical protein
MFDPRYFDYPRKILNHRLRVNGSPSIVSCCLLGCNQKFPDWVDNEMYAYNNKHSLRSNTKGYDDKTD